MDDEPTGRHHEEGESKTAMGRQHSSVWMWTDVTDLILCEHTLENLRWPNRKHNSITQQEHPTGKGGRVPPWTKGLSNLTIDEQNTMLSDACIEKENGPPKDRI